MYICPICNVLKITGHAHPCPAPSDHPDDKPSNVVDLPTIHVVKGERDGQA